MSRRVIVGKSLATVLLVSFASLAQSLLSQTSPAPPASIGALEFPILMRQNVVAGKTPAGTKVQATLTIATLVDGVVIPDGAILSGQVTESVAKTKTDPSRLSIRIDHAQWKNGSAPIDTYLTAWYYPPDALSALNASPPSLDAPNGGRPWTAMGPMGPPPQRNPGVPPPFPTDDRNNDNSKDRTNFPSSTSNASKHRVPMKDVEATTASDGSIALTAARFNIKIDKATTYVLATPDRPRN